MRSNHRTSGQTLIEFALVFPLFIFLIMGLFDLGRAVFYYITLNTAVREATRYAIVLDKATANKDVVIATKLKEYLWVKELSNNCQLTANPVCKIDVTYVGIVPPTDPTAPFDPKVLVTAEYLYEPITPGIALIVGGDGKIHLDVKSTMLLAPIAKPDS